jgi:hypothetical protein
MRVYHVVIKKKKGKAIPRARSIAELKKARSPTRKVAQSVELGRPFA